MTLDIRPIINAVGPATRLGGLALSENVWRAMRQSHEINYRMEELHDIAGAQIAKAIGAPGALVTAGASASLTLATAACIANIDAKLMVDLPFPKTKKVDVIIQSNHKDPYDHAITAAGGHLKVIGDSTGTTITDFEKAFDENVCAVLWREMEGKPELDLKTCAEIAHKHGVSVIVDGALYIPPLDRLHGYLAAGADYIAVSGGKGFRGPHTSGLLIAIPEKIKIAQLHHLDLDEKLGTWKFEVDKKQIPDLPTNGIGRAMKVGREQIFGLVAAIEEYLQNPEYVLGNQELDSCESVLKSNSNIKYKRVFCHPLNVDTLHIYTPQYLDVDEFYLDLMNGEPRIVCGQEFSSLGILTINPMALLRGQGILIAKRMIELYQNDGGKG